MGQTFEYPNVMIGSRSNNIVFNTSDHTLLGVRMSDNVVGDYQRVTLDVDAELGLPVREGRGGRGRRTRGHRACNLMLRPRQWRAMQAFSVDTSR